MGVIPDAGSVCETGKSLKGEERRRGERRGGEGRRGERAGEARHSRVRGSLETVL